MSSVGTIKVLVERRRFLALMARQDLKSEYGKYRFGLLWTLGEPLLMSLLMYVVFVFIFQTTRGIALDPFIVYLVTGMIPFAWLTRSISSSPRTFRKYGTLLSFSKLPIIVWPLRSVSVGLIEFLLSMPVVVILTVGLGSRFTWGVVLVPVGIAAQALLCLGLAMLGASIGATFSDAQKMTGLIVRMLFWGSPILWFGGDKFGKLQDFLYLNPFYGVLDMYRASIWPTEILTNPMNYLVSGTVILIIFSGGLVLMKTRTREIKRLG